MEEEIAWVILPMLLEDPLNLTFYSSKQNLFKFIFSKAFCYTCYIVNDIVNETCTVKNVSSCPPKSSLPPLLRHMTRLNSQSPVVTCDPGSKFSPKNVSHSDLLYFQAWTIKSSLCWLMLHFILKVTLESTFWRWQRRQQPGPWMIIEDNGSPD